MRDWDRNGRIDARDRYLFHEVILKEDTMMYPMNVARIQASQVVRHGDYVFFLILGAYGDDVNTTEEEQQKFADEQTKIGIDTIASFF